MFEILVAEDDKNTRRFLRAVLEEDGFRVHTAANGQEAMTFWTGSTSIWWCWM